MVYVRILYFTALFLFLLVHLALSIFADCIYLLFCFVRHVVSYLLARLVVKNTSTEGCIPLQAHQANATLPRREGKPTTQCQQRRRHEVSQLTPGQSQAETHHTNPHKVSEALRQPSAAKPPAVQNALQSTERRTVVAISGNYAALKAKETVFATQANAVKGGLQAVPQTRVSEATQQRGSTNTPQFVPRTQTADGNKRTEAVEHPRGTPQQNVTSNEVIRIQATPQVAEQPRGTTQHRVIHEESRKTKATQQGAEQLQATTQQNLTSEDINKTRDILQAGEKLGGTVLQKVTKGEVRGTEATQQAAEQLRGTTLQTVIHAGIKNTQDTPLTAEQPRGTIQKVTHKEIERAQASLQTTRQPGGTSLRHVTREQTKQIVVTPQAAERPQATTLQRVTHDEIRKTQAGELPQASALNTEIHEEIVKVQASLQAVEQPRGATLQSVTPKEDQRILNNPQASPPQTVICENIRKTQVTPQPAEQHRGTTLQNVAKEEIKQIQATPQAAEKHRGTTLQSVNHAESKAIAMENTAHFNLTQSPRTACAVSLRSPQLPPQQENAQCNRIVSSVDSSLERGHHLLEMKEANRGVLRKTDFDDDAKTEAETHEPLCAQTHDVHVPSDKNSETKKKRQKGKKRKAKKSESEKAEPIETESLEGINGLATYSRENVAEASPEGSELCSIGDFLYKQPGNTVIFQPCVDVYVKDPLQFTVDVVSLWNTPRRDKAFIVFGVTPNKRFPHTVIGLPEGTTEALFQDMFQWHLFQQQAPTFTYREKIVSKKRVGVLEIEPNRECGFPSIVSSDVIAPLLVKNQLWARRNGQNTVIEPSDQFVADIYTWFQEKAQVVDTETNTQNHAGQHISPVDGDEDPKPNPSQTEEAETENAASLNGTVQRKDKKGRRSAQTHRMDITASSVPALMKALNNFESGHFVLVCGSLSRRSNKLRALARVPWLAVYDFDFTGRDSGLLATVEDSMKRSQGLSVCTWCDPHSGLTDLGTQWWSMRGRREVPQSRTSDSSHQDWFARVRDRLDDLCAELARFSEDYTVLTVLVLWPCRDIEERCVHKLLVRVREYVQPKLILCSTDPDTDLRQSRVVEMVQYEYEDKAELFNDVCMEDLCDTIAHTLPDTIRARDSALYELPAYDDGDAKTALGEKDATWLAQDLDVLYLRSSAPKRDLTPNNLNAEKDNFFRGGTIRWYARYALGKRQVDVERDIFKELRDYIQKRFASKYRNGVVTLYHAPGSGGSTMAQRVLWDLHEKVPCAQVKQRTGSSLEELADRLQLLHDTTHKPVLALLDGEDEPRLKHIVFLLQRSHVILLHVRRYPYPIKESHVDVKHSDFDDPNPVNMTFFLSGFVSKRESQFVLDTFAQHCQAGKERTERLKKLNSDIQSDKEKHQLFEFGMAVYADEYRGLRAYVQGYLGLDPNPHLDLDPWQRSLGYMALVYYYGHCPMPCQFLANIMRLPKSTAAALKDFPQQLQILVVEETNMGKKGFLRVAHQLIAREILEQILCRGKRRVRALDGSGGGGGRGGGGGGRGSPGELSREAKFQLKDLCLDFLQQIQDTNRRSARISHMVVFTLTKTFIFRDTEEVRTAEEVQTRRKPLFSQVMLDLDAYPPYESRHEVFETLCQTFPDDPNFRAHVGRFFSLCREEEEEQTDGHFEEALNLCYALSKGVKQPGEMDEKVKQTLIHVLHMFGNAFQRRIVKFTGWNPGDKPALRTATADVERRLSDVIFNAGQACHYFTQARRYTTPGQEDGYTFMSEIQVRLQACDFVSRVYPGGLQALLSSKKETTEVSFVRGSVPIIDDLIRACYSAAMLDMTSQGPLLMANVRWYSSLFHSLTPQLGSLVEGEDVVSLRLDIAALKLKFRSPDNIIAMESPRASANDIGSIVSKLEKVFDMQASHGHNDSNSNTRTLDLDYLDWILAIRNPNFDKTYKVDQVLRQIRRWYDTSQHSAQAVFYLFVLNSLIGFGSSTSAGNQQCLREARRLQEDGVQKAMKTVARPRQPREWVGKDSLKGIRRLLPASAVKHTEHHITDEETLRTLAVFKGTICRGNKKVAGFIDLDLGENSTPVKVFFNPLFAKMVGSRYQGDRVQFVLTFTFDKGYEAYEVRPLERAACRICNTEREMTWDCPEDLCTCGGVVVTHQ